MEIIKATNKQAVAKTVRHLKEGGICIYPTETSYGIGAAVDEYVSLEGIRALKGRPTGKFFIALVSGIPMAQKYVELGPLGTALAKAYWPGPLTIVAPPKKKGVAQYLASTQGVAMRHSNNRFASQVVKKLGVPITATSANRAGMPACHSIPAVVRQFGKRRLEGVLLIDAGRLTQSSPSTIIRVRTSSLKLLRKGSLVL